MTLPASELVSYGLTMMKGVDKGIVTNTEKGEKELGQRKIAETGLFIARLGIARELLHQRHPFNNRPLPVISRHFSDKLPKGIWSAAPGRHPEFGSTISDSAGVKFIQAFDIYFLGEQFDDAAQGEMYRYITEHLAVNLDFDRSSSTATCKIARGEVHHSLNSSWDVIESKIQPRYAKFNDIQSFSEPLIADMGVPYYCQRVESIQNPLYREE